MVATVVSVALGLLYATGATALENGVGKLPALGFNSKTTPKCFQYWRLTGPAWNVYQCDYTADVLLKQAQALVDHGLLKAGYNVCVS
jgi:alpha-galactosidase